MPLQFLIVDATEGSEVGVYLVDGRDAPGHMKRRLASIDQTVFSDLIEDDDPGLNGLVDENSDRAEERAAEVWEWIQSKTTRENIFQPAGGRVLITHTISIAAA